MTSCLVIAMLYDYVIAGSGIAGNVCAFLLSKKGYKCLILEKEKERKEKICGGGVSAKALEMLHSIGMDMSELFKENFSYISGDCFRNENLRVCAEHDYQKKAIGINRSIFDDFLMTQAIKAGASIKWGEKVKEVIKYNNLFNVNGNMSKHFVSAIGARGFDIKRMPKGQSIGISCLIRGEAPILDNRFNFWYYNDKKDSYFWAFPIGYDLWNTGSWHRHRNKYIHKQFENSIEFILKPYFPNGFEIVRKPKGEFLGNVNQSVNLSYGDGIGDFAGTNNIVNGGGIHHAIASAINYSKDI